MSAILLYVEETTIGWKFRHLAKKKTNIVIYEAGEKLLCYKTEKLPYSQAQNLVLCRMSRNELILKGYDFQSIFLSPLVKNTALHPPVICQDRIVMSD